MAPHPQKARTGLLTLTARIALIWLSLISPSLRAADVGISPEFQVKAVFLYNFAQFVEWPENAFQSPESPLVIGILGADPFGEFLEDTVQGETVNGRRLVIERYRWVGEIDQCHVLFVSGSEGPREAHIIAALRDRPILTVCDWEGLAHRGAMIQFVMQRNRVRIRINLDSAKRAGLSISSKLLRSAEMVIQSRRSP